MTKVGFAGVVQMFSGLEVATKVSIWLKWLYDIGLKKWVLWSPKWHAVFFHGCCSQIMVIKTPKPDKRFARVWWLTLHGIGFSRTLSMPWRSSWTRFQLKTFVELYSELHQWFAGPKRQNEIWRNIVRFTIWFRFFVRIRESSYIWRILQVLFAVAALVILVRFISNLASGPNKSPIILRNNFSQFLVHFRIVSNYICEHFSANFGQIQTSLQSKLQQQQFESKWVPKHIFLTILFPKIWFEYDWKPIFPGDLLCIVNDLTRNETELEIVSLAGPFHQVNSFICSDLTKNDSMIYKCITEI